MKVNTNIKMDIFTTVPLSGTAHKCVLCDTICHGSYGKRAHEDTQKHINAVQKHNEEEQKKERIRSLKRRLEREMDWIKHHTTRLEDIHGQLLQLALN